MTSDVNFAFIHGGGQGSWVWRETIAALGRQAGGSFGRVVALDAPGCGEKRARRTDDLSIEDVARELTGELESKAMRNVLASGLAPGPEHLQHRGTPIADVLQTFASRLKAQKIVRIDAGHQVMNTRPEALAEILRYEAGDRP